MNRDTKLLLILVIGAAALEIALGCQIMTAAYERVPDSLHRLQALPKAENIAPIGYFLPVVAGLLFTFSYSLGLQSRRIPQLIALSSWLAALAGFYLLGMDAWPLAGTALLWGIVALLWPRLKRQVKPR